MASAWGKSWGLAFGAAFGAMVASSSIPPPEVIGGGGTQFRESIDAEIHQQILQEDEAIIIAVTQLIMHGAFT